MKTMLLPTRRSLIIGLGVIAANAHDLKAAEVVKQGYVLIKDQTASSLLLKRLPIIDFLDSDVTSFCQSFDQIQGSAGIDTPTGLKKVEIVSRANSKAKFTLKTNDLSVLELLITFAQSVRVAVVVEKGVIQIDDP